MADHFYSTSVPGATIGSVTKGTATAGTNIELRVTDGVAGNSKAEIAKALEAIADFILTDNAPA
jgi:hypothetical protein